MKRFWGPLVVAASRPWTSPRAPLVPVNTRQSDGGKEEKEEVGWLQSSRMDSSPTIRPGAWIMSLNLRARIQGPQSRDAAMLALLSTQHKCMPCRRRRASDRHVKMRYSTATFAAAGTTATTFGIFVVVVAVSGRLLRPLGASVGCLYSAEGRSSFRPSRVPIHHLSKSSLLLLTHADPINHQHMQVTSIRREARE